MKRCPTCNQTFDEETLNFCPNDGSGLVSETKLNPPPELQATMMATPSSLGGSSYPPPPPSSGGPGSGSFNPPPPNPTWTPPSTPSANSAPKGGGINKKLLFGGLGCVGLAVIVGVVAIVLLFAFSGPSSKMNPYKGDLKALVPENLGKYKRTDVDSLRDADKKYLGKVNEGYGVSYKGSTDEEISMLVCNYASSKDAADGLKSFTDEGVSNGWSRSEKGSKKIGWRTVGDRYTMTKDFPTGKVDERPLRDGAVIVRAQAAVNTKSTQREFVAWTNGSVVYVVGAPGTLASDFEKVLDSEGK